MYRILLKMLKPENVAHSLNLFKAPFFYPDMESSYLFGLASVRIHTSIPATRAQTPHFRHYSMVHKQLNKSIPTTRAGTLTFAIIAPEDVELASQRRETVAVSGRWGYARGGD